ncbi:hypothetical protein SAMN04487981_10497 [Streptomyces sp. cf386]|nr:hypothetical protein SAMN04487981_10497 [Streptomyces sp. cf386]
MVVPLPLRLPSDRRRPRRRIQTLGFRRRLTRPCRSRGRLTLPCRTPRRLTPPYGTLHPRRWARTDGFPGRALPRNIPRRRALLWGTPRRRTPLRDTPRSRPRHRTPPRKTRRPRAPPPHIPRHRLPSRRFPRHRPMPMPHAPPRRLLPPFAPLSPLPRSPQRPACRVGRSGLGVPLSTRLVRGRLGVRGRLVGGHLELLRLLHLLCVLRLLRLPRVLRLPTGRTPPLTHPAHDSLRSETRSDSSRAVSSVRADSPEPRIASARARLDSSISAMRSSTVPSVMRRWTWTGWVWPMR